MADRRCGRFPKLPALGADSDGAPGTDNVPMYPAMLQTSIPLSSTQISSSTSSTDGRGFSPRAPPPASANAATPVPHCVICIVPVLYVDRSASVGAFPEIGASGIFGIDDILGVVGRQPSVGSGLETWPASSRRSSLGRNMLLPGAAGGLAAAGTGTNRTYLHKLLRAQRRRLDATPQQRNARPQNWLF